MNASDQKPSAPAAQPKKPAAHVTELKTLVVDYAKQEVVTPVKSLGGYLSKAFLAAALMGIGSIFLVLALLRGMQQLSIFNPEPYDGFSFRTLIPYAIALVGAALLLGLGYIGITRDSRVRRKG